MVEEAAEEAATFRVEDGAQFAADGEDDGDALSLHDAMVAAEQFTPASFAPPAFAAGSSMLVAAAPSSSPAAGAALAAPGPGSALVTAATLQQQQQQAPGGTSVHAAGPILMVTRPLPRVLLLHTGGTLGMDPHASYEAGDESGLHLKEGTGGVYPVANQLQPGRMLADLLATIPELRTFANLEVHVLFNKDSCRIGPPEWVRIAKTLHAARPHFDAFILVHGTDTMAYTASALSLLLGGFRKPIILTGRRGGRGGGAAVTRP